MPQAWGVLPLFDLYTKSDLSLLSFADFVQVNRLHYSSFHEIGMARNSR